MRLTNRLSILIFIWALPVLVWAQFDYHHSAHIYPKGADGFRSEFVFGDAGSHGALVAQMSKWNTQLSLNNYGTFDIGLFPSINPTGPEITPLFSVGHKSSIIALEADQNTAYVGIRYADSLVVADSLLDVADQWTPTNMVLAWDLQDNKILWTKSLDALQDFTLSSSGELIVLTTYPGSSALLTLGAQGVQLDSTFIDNALSGHLDLDQNDNRYISGLASGYDTVKVGSFSHYSGGSGLNVFALKVSPNGEGRWFQSSTDVNYAFPFIRCDELGHVWLTGELFLQQIWGNYTLAGSQWVYDFFLVKMDTSGTIEGAWETPNTTSITGDYRLASRQPIARSDSGVVLMLTNRGGVPFNGTLPLGGTTSPQDRGITFLEFQDGYTRGITYGTTSNSYITASGLQPSWSNTAMIWGAGLAYSDTLHCHTAAYSLDSIYTDVLGLIQLSSNISVYENPDIARILYPNPTSGQIHASPAWEEKERCEVRDLRGRLLYEGHPENWSAEHLPKGLYILKVGGEVYRIGVK